MNFWNRVSEEKTELIGPPLLFAEVSSVLRLRVFLGEFQPDEGDGFLEELFRLEIAEVNPPGLTRAAWELAKRFNHPRTYDAQYLALAELEGCEFWTADRRLYNSVRDQLPWVKLAGESR